MNITARLLAVLSLAALVSACDDGSSTTSTGGDGGTGGGTGGDTSGGAGGGDGGTGGSSAGGGGAGGSGVSFTVTKGFNVAESCLWDPVSEHWYVSNIAPQSMDLLMPDGVGYISRLDKDGAIVDEQWVSGFDTPAGLRIAKGVLYVNDLTKVHGIDIASAAVTEQYTFPAAILLNDPAIDEANGIGYATDTVGNAIYTFKIGEAGSEDVLVASPDLKGPNGLLFDNGKLLVASLVDFDPANLGPFLSVDPATKTITEASTKMGKWDGLEKWEGGYLLSDNAVSQLVLIQPDGTSEIVYDLMAEHGFAPAADIGVDPDRGIVCIPNLGDSVAFLKLK